MEQKFKKVRALITNNGDILLMRRNKFGEKYYSFPGGSVEGSDTEEQALQREIDEETSVQVEILGKVYEYQSDRWGPQSFFECRYQGGEPMLSPDSNEAASTKKGRNTYQPEWVSIKNLKKFTVYPEQISDVISKLGTIDHNQTMEIKDE